MNDRRNQDDSTERLAEGLGWFSIALGLAEVAAPGSVARLIGLRPDSSTVSTLRAFGLREIGSGIAILADPRRSGRVWSRVGGDALESAISAASILAKTTRDAMMVDLCARYPGYGFSQHKGYGVAAHLEALRRLGPCPVHRRSFRPVREALGILDKVIVARQLPLPGVVAS
jgi:hypothetical protein